MGLKEGLFDYNAGGNNKFPALKRKDFKFHGPSIPVVPPPQRYNIYQHYAGHAYWTIDVVLTAWHIDNTTYSRSATIFIEYICDEDKFFTSQPIITLPVFLSQNFPDFTNTYGFTNYNITYRLSDYAYFYSIVEKDTSITVGNQSMHTIGDNIYYVDDFHINTAATIDYYATPYVAKSLINSAIDAEVAKYQNAVVHIPVFGQFRNAVGINKYSYDRWGYDRIPYYYSAVPINL